MKKVVLSPVDTDEMYSFCSGLSWCVLLQSDKLFLLAILSLNAEIVPRIVDEKGQI